METALMFSCAQIVQGEAGCVYCDTAAAVTLSTGADPEPEPLCWRHASQMLVTSLNTAETLFGAVT